jgi:archaeal flagellin FlaB
MKRMGIDKQGEMGVGTMIVFIAVVLVAAVAATVLISTSNMVREQASQTGADAIASASTGFNLEFVTGDVTGNAVTDLHVVLRLAAGSQNISMDNVVVSMITSSGSTSTKADMICNSSNVAYIGNMIELTISGLSLGPGDHVSMLIMPKAGFNTNVDLTIPYVLTSSTVSLR